MSTPLSDEVVSNAAPQHSASARRWWLLASLLAVLVLWLLTGFYVVRGNEAAVVRVCGKAERIEDGSVLLRPSGLHYHFPWPIAAVDRVNINEVRTVTIGALELDDLEGSNFLAAVDPARQSQFLSGDKNVLHVQVNVHYRVSPEQLGDWLYGSRAVDQRLQLMAGAVLSDVVLRCGVDFVHTLGHSDIRRAALLRLRTLVARDQLGVEIEDLTIASVIPPVRVKAEFVDVMNARADRETSINRAKAYAEQREADARAVERRVSDEAASYRRRMTDIARAEADSFNRLIDELKKSTADGSISYDQARRLTMQRLHMEAVEDIYRRLAGKIVINSDSQVDITLQPQK